MFEDLKNADGKTKALIAFVIIICLAYFGLVEPIAQNQKYHAFADTWSFIGINNFFNVASNLIYLIVGLMGMYFLHDNWQNSEKFSSPSEAFPFYVMFVGAVLLGFGSAFYHLDPKNITLMADRFTMTVGFMGALSFIIVERISKKWGLKLLPVLLTIGIASVIYWIAPEMKAPAQIGDLRPYALVQMLSLAMILIVYFLYPAKYSHGKYILFALGLYALAKVLETYDHQIFDALGTGLSGHTLKHLSSGLGIYCLLIYLTKRSRL